MTTQDTATVAISFYERVSAGDVAAAVALIGEDYVGHGMGSAGGPESVRRDLRTWLAAVPDLHIDVHDTIAQDDRVTVRMTLRGTQSGEFAGFPASSRRFEIGGTDVMRVRDGSIVEAWTLCDLASMFMQVGALPTPGLTGATRGGPR